MIRKSLIFSYLAFVIVIIFPFQSFAELKINLAIDENQRIFNNCKGNISGVHEGTHLWIKSLISGGKGVITLKYFWGLEGYDRPFALRDNEIVEKKRKIHAISSKILKNRVMFYSYKLRPELDFVQQMISVLATDQDGETAHASILFNVSRSIIVGPSPNHSLNCFQSYSPKLQTGIICNNTVNEENITQTRGREIAHSNLSQNSWGWSISPNIFYGGVAASIFSYHKNYLKQKSLRVGENTFMSLNYKIDPGECIAIYRQQMRFKDVYKVYHVDQCGQSKRVGDIKYQYWKEQYPAVNIDPSIRNPFENVFPGIEERNTCEDSDEDGSYFLPDNEH